MPKRIKKKKAQQADFVKKKKKVGKPKRDKTPSLRVQTRQLNMPSQRLGVDKGDQVVTRRNLALGDLLGQTNHFAASVRRDAMLGVRELFEQLERAAAADAADAAHDVLRSSAGGAAVKATAMLDDASIDVRRAVLGALAALLAASASTLAPATLELCMARIAAAITHVSVAVRADALAALRLFARHRPHALTAHADALLRILSDVLCQAPASTSGAQLMPVVSCLSDFLRVVLAADKDETAAADETTAAFDTADDAAQTPLDDRCETRAALVSHVVDAAMPLPPLNDVIGERERALTMAAARSTTTTANATTTTSALRPAALYSVLLRIFLDVVNGNDDASACAVLEAWRRVALYVGAAPASLRAHVAPHVTRRFPHQFAPALAAMAARLLVLCYEDEEEEEEEEDDEEEDDDDEPAAWRRRLIAFVCDAMRSAAAAASAQLTPATLLLLHRRLLAHASLRARLSGALRELVARLKGASTARAAALRYASTPSVARRLWPPLFPLFPRYLWELGASSPSTSRRLLLHLLRHLQQTEPTDVAAAVAAAGAPPLAASLAPFFAESRLGAAPFLMFNNEADELHADVRRAALYVVAYLPRPLPEPLVRALRALPDEPLIKRVI